MGSTSYTLKPDTDSNNYTDHEIANIEVIIEDYYFILKQKTEKGTNIIALDEKQYKKLVKNILEGFKRIVDTVESLQEIA